MTTLPKTRQGLVFMVFCLAAACSRHDGAAAPGPDAGPSPVCKTAPPPAVGSRWFTDVTADAGLTGVTGIRVAAADLDGDGFVDLVVHGSPTSREGAVKVLMNDHGHFVDKTAESGFLDSRDGPGTGRFEHLVVFGDVDGDGDLDAFDGTYQDGSATAPASKDRNEIRLNDGKGHFTFAPQSAPSKEAFFPTTSASFVDYDRDGKLDLFVGSFYTPNGLDGAGNRLYHGNGDGTFTDASASSHVLRDGANGDTSRYLAGTYRRPAYGVTACDLDGDGDDDLITSSYGRGWNELWRNEGNGTFTDVGQGTSFAADDGLDWHDNEFYRCWCQAHAGSCPPEESKPAIDCTNYSWTPGFDDQPARLGGNTFSSACGDLDDDGDLDVLHAEIRHWHIGLSSDPSEILRNDGNLAFTRLTQEASGIARPHVISDWNEGDLDVAFFDADNDGKKDIYLSSTDYPETYGTLFHGDGNMHFTDIGDAAGVRHYHAHGFAAVDIDDDGDLDLVVSTSTARCTGDPKCPATQEVRVYRNDVGSSQNVVQLALVGTGGSNVSAIGARVAVTAGGHTQVQELQGGYGHFGMEHGTMLTFGLGAACAVDTVEVRWPDAAHTTERFTALRANTRVRITQGAGDAGLVTLP